MNYRKVISIVAAFVAAIIIIGICTFKVMDIDFWWHIKAGEVMLRTGMITTDIFSYTRHGQPYYATYEWLAQILLYVVHYFGGITGIILFRSGMVITAFSLLMLINPSELLFSSFVAVLGANAGRSFFTERPQLFTYVCFSLFLLMAYRYKESGNKKYLWALIPVQIFWVNVHGAACLLGCGVVGLLIIDKLAQGLAREPVQILPTPRDIKDTLLLVCIALCLVVATLLSPNTYHVFTYLYSLLNDKTISFIQEWQPVALGTLTLNVAPLLVICVASFMFNRRKDVFSLLIFLVTGYLAVKAFRNQVLFAFAMTAVTMYNMKASPWWQRMTGRIFSTKAIAVITLLMLFSGAGLYSYANYMNISFENYLFGFGVFQPAAGAYRFVEQNHIPGEMFNTYSIGGYLIWQGYPKRKVFVDGRNVDYGFDFLQKTFHSGKDPSLWKKLEDQYGFSYAIIDYGSIKRKHDIPYCDHLDKNPQWKLVYMDDWCAVYVKDIPENRSVIEKNAYHMINPENIVFFDNFAGIPKSGYDELERELKEMADGNPADVKGRLLLSKLYYIEGRLGEAEHLARAITQERKYMPDGYEVLAGIYLQRSDFVQSAAYYNKSISLSRNFYPNINYNFVADVFEKAGDHTRAMYYRQRASKTHDEMGNTPEMSVQNANPSPSDNQSPLQQFPNQVKAAHDISRELIDQPNEMRNDAIYYYSIAEKQESQGLIDDAIRSYSNAIKVDSHYAPAFNNLGILFSKKRDMEKSRTYFEGALKANPNYSDAYNNMGVMYQLLGDTANAEKQYKKAIEIKPSYAEAHYNLGTLYFRLKKYDRSLKEAQQAEQLGYNASLLKQSLRVVVK